MAGHVYGGRAVAVQADGSNGQRSVGVIGFFLVYVYDNFNTLIITIRERSFSSMMKITVQNEHFLIVTLQLCRRQFS